MTHADRIAAERARKQRERATRKEAGYVWRGLWVRPEVWDKIRAYADRQNRKVSEARPQNPASAPKEGGTE